MGGEHWRRLAMCEMPFGSSPHGRGTSSGGSPKCAVCRVIPAWAGNIVWPRTRSIATSGHPRMGGEHIRLSPLSMGVDGSSPHGRGTSGGSGALQPPARVIPAWAGNITLAMPAARAVAGHPRMGGEHSGRMPRRPRLVGSSPHGRGTSGRRRAGEQSYRVIPAWAGNIRSRSAVAAGMKGHPRMGGEHAFRNLPMPCRSGSSPHGRGT